ncbi:hypothetical protein CDL12_30159 [Handroanthus impetiginosus]|uniref:Seed maturation protein n=1 Tax=Handroanthus impetiginosus TaxID=429701 RepID=A0A2G9FWR3_9LAMI|nr:hypothetical protein CDL12_30159 [Handroanthus impetiginosus]
MAMSKDDVKYGTAQAKLSEDEALRVRYKAGTPLEGGKIADSEPVDLFSSAHNISAQQQNEGKIAESEPVDLFSSAGNINKQGTRDEQQPSQSHDQYQHQR